VGVLLHPHFGMDFRTLAWGLGGGGVPAKHRVGGGAAHAQPTSAARQFLALGVCLTPT